MNLEEKIDKALEDFQFLEEQDRENVMVNEQVLLRTAYKALDFQQGLAEKGNESNPNASKFKSSVNILIQFYKMSKECLNQSSNFEKKAFYWKMKYDSVVQEEEMQEILKENLQRLLDENERLLDKIQTLEK